jgi:hypothetical protein
MRIFFHNKIYSKKVIQEAIKHFNELAYFNVNKDGNYAEVNISNIEQELLDVFYEEFTNYVLCLQKKDTVL